MSRPFPWQPLLWGGPHETLLCPAMGWQLVCPLSMVSNDICGVGRTYLMPPSLCMKPASACVTPSSFRTALTSLMPLVIPAPGTVHSSLTPVLPGVNANTGLPHLLLGTQSSQLPALVQEVRTLPFTLVGGKRPVARLPEGNYWGALFVSLILQSWAQTQVQSMLLATCSPILLDLWTIALTKGF